MKKIKLLKEIELNAKRQGKNIICFDMNTVNLVLGTSTAAGNLHMYGVVKKEPREWVIPIASIEKRIEKMERDIDSYSTRIKFIKQVIKSGSGRNKKLHK